MLRLSTKNLLKLCAFLPMLTLDIAAVEIPANTSISQMQFIGSHNSYKQPIPNVILAEIKKHDERRAVKLDYFHPPLEQQLDLGLRLLEIDVVRDPKGNKFASPKSAQKFGLAAFSKGELAKHSQAGLKVLHIPDEDVNSHCISFVECLTDVKTWSDLHPNHLPIFILLNVKQSGSKIFSSTNVLKFDKSEHLTLIDDEIRQVLGNKLFSPDDLRGNASSLSKVVTTKGWPKVDAMRGKVLFIFDAKTPMTDLYRKGHSALTGRAMFASYPAGDKEAAIHILNSPVKQFSEIQQLVKAGYLVRTRSDKSNYDALENNILQVEKAFESGAQLISTDYYLGSPMTGIYDFLVRFPGLGHANIRVK